MRYRKLDADGDMTFGHGAYDYLVDSPQAVAQAVLTRLLLMQGEWFLDVTEGTPYGSEILGKGTAGTYDYAIRSRILDTIGVAELIDYQSRVDGRSLTVSAKVQTIYGEATFEVTI